MKISRERQKQEANFSERDRRDLRRIAGKYPAAIIEAELKRIAQLPKRGRGAPRQHSASLIAIYADIEARRLMGKNVSVVRASEKLADLLSKWTVDSHYSASHIRTMHRKAKKLLETNQSLRNLAEELIARRKAVPKGTLSIPALVWETSDGGLRSVIIDRYGRGGRG